MRTVRDWLGRIDKDAKEARNKRIFDLWLACWTNVDIADAVGVRQDSLKDSFRDFGDIAKIHKTQQSAAEHATDFTVPNWHPLPVGMPTATVIR